MERPSERTSPRRLRGSSAGCRASSGALPVDGAPDAGCVSGAAELIALEAGAGGGLGGLVNRYLSVPHADDGLRCVVSAGRLRGATALGTGGATICGSTRRTVIASSFASRSPAGPF